MPYIKKDRRMHYCNGINSIEGARIENPGELNYLISSLCKIYSQSKDKFDYSIINDVIGALEAAKHEYIRRLVEAYEDEKIEENGDMYDIDNI